jgi:hypothetical protein
MEKYLICQGNLMRNIKYRIDIRQCSQILVITD